MNSAEPLLEIKEVSGTVANLRVNNLPYARGGGGGGHIRQTPDGVQGHIEPVWSESGVVQETEFFLVPEEGPQVRCCWEGWVDARPGDGQFVQLIYANGEPAFINNHATDWWNPLSTPAQLFPAPAFSLNQGEFVATSILTVAGFMWVTSLIAGLVFASSPMWFEVLRYAGGVTLGAGALYLFVRRRKKLALHRHQLEQAGRELAAAKQHFFGV